MYATCSFICIYTIGTYSKGISNYLFYFRWTSNPSRAEKLHKSMVRTNTTFSGALPVMQLLQVGSHCGSPWKEESFSGWWWQLLPPLFRIQEVGLDTVQYLIPYAVVFLMSSIYLVRYVNCAINCSVKITSNSFVLVFREAVHVKHWTARAASPRVGVDTHQHMWGEV